MICRGIICNLVVIAMQQECSNLLKDSTSTANRDHYINLNMIRQNLYQLLRQLKAKTAENNMLIDYRSYFQFIHTDIIQQLIQWQS